MKEIFTLNNHFSDVEIKFKDIGGLDMGYYEFKEMCRKAWSENINYFRIDMTKNINERKYRIFKRNKNTCFECIPESEAF